MLGIESPRKPITGQFAKELREALVRARTGNLNQSEKESVLRSEKVSQSTMQSGNNEDYIDLVFERIDDASILSNFYCGIPDVNS